jgi:dolichol kinase
VASSLAAAVIALEAPIATARALLLAATAAAATVEVVRHLSPAVGRLFNRAFGTMLRNHEARGAITGATAMATGFAATVLFVPTPFAAAGILMAGIGDAAGALVGRRFGRRRIARGKSLEGSLACLAAAFASAALVPGIPWPAAAVAALITAALELAPLPWDDNLALPLLSALALWGTAALLTVVL